jgi:hypothetical protein
MAMTTKSSIKVNALRLAISLTLKWLRFEPFFELQITLVAVHREIS